MPVSASLTVARVDVVPGGTATVELTVRNTGAVVDEFRIEVLGSAAEYITPSPAIVPLFPGASAPVVLTIAPSRSSDVAAGELDVAVKVVSREDPDGTAVEEFLLVVAGFDNPDAELIPRVVRGGRSAKVRVAIDNHGNRRTQRTVTATDGEHALRFRAEPTAVAVEPGRAEFIDVIIKPEKTFLRGAEKTIPYRVRLDDGTAAIQLDGTYVQTPLLPRWLVRLLGLLLALLLLLLLLWQFALKPVIKSAARAAATAQVDQAADKAAKEVAQAIIPNASIPSSPGGGATTTVPGGSSGGDAGGDSPGSPGGPSAGESSGGGGGDDGRGGAAVDKRLTVEAAAGQTVASEDWNPAGDGGRFSLTDVVLQNPNGDAGSLRVKRGDEVLFESALENFRDLDFHFVAPYIVAGQPLRIEVTCRNAEGGQPCRPAVSFGGFLAGGAPAAPTADTVPAASPDSIVGSEAPETTAA
jgi:hypothetical protein